ncbi:hypothetical protein AMTR_s00092p00108750 [Amborella trichopoda]|uniref:Uncharacterized protein n=1 Tax=Amborella trichopoda TaxID=13333 RepID=W1NX15_AMBTC|nr:hypothetical protein AMTR_s00092p00108750 [Amborella trichopoda]
MASMENTISSLRERKDAIMGFDQNDELRADIGRPMMAIPNSQRSRKRKRNRKIYTLVVYKKCTIL